MEIQFPTTLPLAVATRAAPSALPWAVNDVVVAQVVGQKDQNFTRLAIGDRLVLARTEAPLALGQSLKLQVTSLGAQPVLKVLDATPPAAAQASAVDRGLARVLPRQAGAEEARLLVQDVTLLARDTKAIAERLGPQASAALRGDLRELLASLPTQDDVTDAPRLRDAVSEASASTESRVLRALTEGAAPDVSRDLRAQLARVGADLAALPAPAREALATLVRHEAPESAARTEAPPPPGDVADARTSPRPDAGVPDIKRLVDGVVARLEAQQLQNAAASDTALPMLVELPVARGAQTDMLQLAVEREARAAEDGQAGRTSVTLNLRLDDNVEFSARLQLSGDTLSLRLGSTDADFNAELERRLAELETGLLGAGLNLGALLLAPLQVDQRPRLGARQLINERV
ncbi:MAG: hypothetical protein AB7I01_00880 [Gammaproteobacteria bacterium]